MINEAAKKILLISAKQLKHSSTIELNVDEKLLSQAIYDVQTDELRAVLQNELYYYILTQVYAKAQTGVVIPDDIKELLDDYIIPFLIPAVLDEFIFTNQYKIANAGTEKLSGSNFQPVSSDELQTAIQFYKAKKSTRKKLLIEELKRRKLLSVNAEVSSTENYGFYIPENEPTGQSTLENEGVIINDIVGIDFDDESGDLSLIDASANRITTNIDGRYRLSKYITDTIHSGTFTLLQFNPANSKGCFIDYTLRHDSNQRTGRIIANWLNQAVTYVDYASPTIGTLTAVVSFDYNEEHDRFLFKISPNINEVYVTLLVTTI